MKQKNTNIVVLATHGGYHIPQNIASKLTKEFQESRLIKNFSDFATHYILPKNIPAKNMVVAKFSRALGDPNRDKNAHDLFREYDFGGNKIWATPLTKTEKQDMIENFYDLYHDAVMDVIEAVENQKQTVIVFDIHDTGSYLLGKTKMGDRKKEQSFPMINLGNKYGSSCDPQIMKECERLIKKHFGEKPSVNAPYNGGFVTTQYGKNYNETQNDKNKFHRNVIQVEFNRSLYMNEQTQDIDMEKAQKVQRNLENVLEELGVLYA